uniref:THAP-type domain-containing protein n=1 Tax=Photinus pyralis TaxID=7054 RepID=A0A1Y1KNY4_PHOPY
MTVDTFRDEENMDLNCCNTLTSSSTLYPGDWMAVAINMRSPRTQKYIFMMKDTIQNQKKTIKRLRQRTIRQKKRIQNLQSLLSKLKNKNLISEKAEVSMQVKYRYYSLRLLCN